VLPLLVAAACSRHACGAVPVGSSAAPATATPAPTPARADDASDAALQARLHQALAAKGPGYVPRTRHLNADGTPKYTNRLILESSPYLLQHAHNPVNWFAWGDEAFERARRLGRPVFLSVGYSTCHWCHVMEEESFEDEALAAYLNEHYVCIKVDREERPDIDAAYMSFVQAMTQRGGWPMNVWLTPAREPFFGGTYFPPRAGVRGARQGLSEILRAQADAFTADPAGVARQASSLAQRLRSATAPEPAGDFPSASLIAAAAAEAARRFDPAMGGARGAPKFPSSFPVQLLLRVARRSGDVEPRRMALLTLDRMRAGGIYDQVGGGFHRYATDAQWLVPHFEKMLYDNALLAVTYLEASQAAPDAGYARTVREILDYLLRDMRAPDGTFYSATDADSPNGEGQLEEGLYFTWTPAELRAVLGADDARLAAAWLGVTDQGQLDGRSVLHRVDDATPPATGAETATAPAGDRASSILDALRVARAHRRPPLRDEKVIVAWNALTISALARAAVVLGEPRYADAAVACASVLLAAAQGERGPPHVLVAGQPQGRAFADDQVLLAAALLDVFELTCDAHFLDDAARVMEDVERSFADTANGGYFLSAAQHETLLLRDKPDRDGPIPSVSSVAALVLLRLFTLTEDARYRQRAETTVRAFARTLARDPLALDAMLLALDFATDAPKELVIVVPEGRGALAPGARPLLDVLQRRFAPNAVLVVATAADIEHTLGSKLPWTGHKALRSGRATAYVCERGTCQLPTTEPAVFATQLAAVRPYR